MKLPKWLRYALTTLGIGTTACMKVTTGTPQVVCGVVGGLLAAIGIVSKNKNPGLELPKDLKKD